ncbi:MAG TPA: orotidine-5'-phosphate decarboxylase [Vicinamibacterales bacterium]|nr:orotidine-5'-phosphate decarboxylase [Vicinamibacterales bacterium]
MDQLLVALDVDSGARAVELASSLRGIAGGFKIGSRLFTLEGPSIVRALTERGDRVFLDLKFHDIPNTVATAVAAATSLGVWMLNVHAAGGRAMMAAAVEAAHDTAARDGRQAPLVIAVTVLTSMNATALSATGVDAAVVDQVVRLARLTQAAGLDGVVASAQETSLIRQACGKNFAIVTPGIRGGAALTSGKDDQERTMTAPEAIAAGANYIVVGRPIIAAADPRQAAEKIAASL